MSDESSPALLKGSQTSINDNDDRATYNLAMFSFDASPRSTLSISFGIHVHGEYGHLPLDSLTSLGLTRLPLIDHTSDTYQLPESHLHYIEPLKIDLPRGTQKGITMWIEFKATATDRFFVMMHCFNADYVSRDTTIASVYNRKMREIEPRRTEQQRWNYQYDTRLRKLVDFKAVSFIEDKGRWQVRAQIGPEDQIAGTPFEVAWSRSPKDKTTSVHVRLEDAGAAAAGSSVPSNPTSAPIPVQQDPYPDTLFIFVRTLGGWTRTLLLFHSSSILNVKKRLEEMTDIPVNEQRLLFGGKTLEDCRTLRDYNIQKESTLDLVVQLRGGMPMVPNYKNGLIDVGLPDGRIAAVVANSTDTIFDFKAKVQRFHGVPPEDQRLMFRHNISGYPRFPSSDNKNLDNSRTLGWYFIEPDRENPVKVMYLRPRDLKIHVKTAFPPGEMTFDVVSTDTIASIRSKVCRAQSMRELPNLKYEGIWLDKDERRLRDCQIPDGAILWVDLPLRWGPGEWKSSDDDTDGDDDGSETDGNSENDGILDEVADEVEAKIETEVKIETEATIESEIKIESETKIESPVVSVGGLELPEQAIAMDGHVETMSFPIHLREDKQ